MLDLTVDFCCADTHTTGVERGIRAAVDDHAVVCGQFGKVAMTPDIVETLEIGCPVFLAIGIIPETDRHDREGARTNQFAFFATHWLTEVIKNIDRHPQAPALDFSAIDGQHRVAEHEAGNNVCPAGNRGKQDVGLDFTINPVKTFWGERAAGRKHRTQCA